jgi:hypothetical protein
MFFENTSIDQADVERERSRRRCEGHRRRPGMSERSGHLFLGLIAARE